MKYELQPTKPRPLSRCGAYAAQDARWRALKHASEFVRKEHPVEFRPAVLTIVDRARYHDALMASRPNKKRWTKEMR